MSFHHKVNAKMKVCIKTQMIFGFGITGYIRPGVIIGIDREYRAGLQ